MVFQQQISGRRTASRRGEHQARVGLFFTSLGTGLTTARGYFWSLILSHTGLASKQLGKSWKFRFSLPFLWPYLYRTFTCLLLLSSRVSFSHSSYLYRFLLPHFVFPYHRVFFFSCLIRWILPHVLHTFICYPPLYVFLCLSLFCSRFPDFVR